MVAAAPRPWYTVAVADKAVADKVVVADKAVVVGTAVAGTVAADTGVAAGPVLLGEEVGAGTAEGIVPAADRTGCTDPEDTGDSGPPRTDLAAAARAGEDRIEAADLVGTAGSDIGRTGREPEAEQRLEAEACKPFPAAAR